MGKVVIRQDEKQRLLYSGGNSEKLSNNRLQVQMKLGLVGQFTERVPSGYISNQSEKFFIVLANERIIYVLCLSVWGRSGRFGKMEILTRVEIET